MSVLTAFYDLERGPISYDFITWLVRARMECAARSCQDLHVVVVPKEDGLGGFSRHWGPHDAAAARWRLWHIVVAACPLAGATVSVAATRVQAEKLRIEPCWWPEERMHLCGPIVERARRGEDVPRLVSTEAAARYVESWLGIKGERVVTLTLRQQANDPARNSNRKAWGAFAVYLRERGYRVVAIDDSHVALSVGQGYAELDPDLRLALYERAEMNIVGNNGPAALLWHSHAPYMRIGAGLPSDWKTNLGLSRGEQLPWATKDQVLVYAPDSFEAMREAFERWAGATS